MNQYRTVTCGALSLKDQGKKVVMSGWVMRARDLGKLTFIDLRDRYGVTQLAFNQDLNAELLKKAREIGREFVIQIEGVVVERSNKNKHIPTGEIEVQVELLSVLNPSLTPPFTLEDETDGGEELRMQYRYLDIRRNPVKNKLLLRHQVGKEVRNFLDLEGFVEVETPFLIKSTPEGARDFIVPSRLNPGSFYALPQSPQTFKQLLMVGGVDKYYQIVKCFRDEDLRADRQPEFTQIDCEMSFVTRSEVLHTFERMVKHVFYAIHQINLPDFPLMSYDEAMESYGSDKPDIRFQMKLHNITRLAQGHGFAIFDKAQAVLAMSVPGGASYTRKQIDALTDFVKRPQIGAQGLIWCKLESGGPKSSVDKFYSSSQLNQWAEQCQAQEGDLLLLMSGTLNATQKQMGTLRLHVADQLGLRDPRVFAPLWVVDFPLLEWDEDSGRYYAMHHPFTSPSCTSTSLTDQNPQTLKANAYDLVINGVEIGGGSVRIHNKSLQKEVFSLLGMSEEEAQSQFGFLMNAFEYGAPPHAGIALGFDRLCSLLGGSESIKDYIAFPKNNQGRDLMIDAPAPVDNEQLNELFLTQNTPPSQSTT